MWSPIHKGFTLIELMVSVTILIIITGAAIGGFTAFQKDKEVSENAEYLIGEINKVYVKALNGYYPEGCTKLEKYEIDFSVKPVVYYAKCTEGNIPDDGIEISLRENMVLVPDNNFTKIGFLVSTGELVDANDIPLVSVSVKAGDIKDKDNLTKLVSISIGNYGEIKIQP